MLKRFTLLMLITIAGVVGNLVAGWIDENAWENWITPSRLLWTGIGLVVMLAIEAFLESEHALPWNWWWHRYWYLREILRNPTFRRWETDFARLDILLRENEISTIQVIKKNEYERSDLVELLENIVFDSKSKSRRILIIGEPGCGKTTALERFALSSARKALKYFGIGAPIPVLVRLGRSGNLDLIERVANAVWETVGGQTGKVIRKGMQYLVEKGQVILLLDALDEALGQNSQKVIDQLDTLLQKAYEETPIVVTSRILDIPLSRFEKLPVYEIQPLNDQAVRLFVRVYKKNITDNDQVILDKLNQGMLLEKQGLGRNPFWLKMIIESGVFQGEKGIILRASAKLLLNREWDGKPEIERTWKRRYEKNAQIPQTVDGLCWLGYEFFVKSVTALDYPESAKILDGWCQKQSQSLRLSPFDILWLGRDAQLLVYSPDPVQFRHRLLQEYFSAEFFVSNPKLLTRELLEGVAQDQSKWPSVYLYGSLLRTVNDLINLTDKIIDSATSINQLWLALACWNWSPSFDKKDKEKFDLFSLNLAKTIAKQLSEQNELTISQIELCHFAVRSSGRIGKDLLKLSASFASPKGRAYLYQILAKLDDPYMMEWVVSQGLSDIDDFARISAIKIIISLPTQTMWPVIRASMKPNSRQPALDVLNTIGWDNIPSDLHEMVVEFNPDTAGQGDTSQSINDQDEFEINVIQASSASDSKSRLIALRNLAKHKRYDDRLMNIVYANLMIEPHEKTELSRPSIPSKLKAIDFIEASIEVVESISQASADVIDALKKNLSSQKSEKIKRKLFNVLETLGVATEEDALEIFQRDFPPNFPLPPSDDNIYVNPVDSFYQARKDWVVRLKKYALDNDQEILTRTRLINYLGATQEKEHLEILFRALGLTENADIHSAAFHAIGYYGVAALPYLQEMSKSDNSLVRRAVANLLYNINDPSAAELLESFSSDIDSVTKAFGEEGERNSFREKIFSVNPEARSFVNLLCKEMVIRLYRYWFFFIVIILGIGVLPRMNIEQLMSDVFVTHLVYNLNTIEQVSTMFLVFFIATFPYLLFETSIFLYNDEGAKKILSSYILYLFIFLTTLVYYFVVVRFTVLIFEIYFPINTDFMEVVMVANRLFLLSLFLISASYIFASQKMSYWLARSMLEIYSLKKYRDTSRVIRVIGLKDGVDPQSIKEGLNSMKLLFVVSIITWLAIVLAPIVLLPLLFTYQLGRSTILLSIYVYIGKEKLQAVNREIRNAPNRWLREANVELNEIEENITGKKRRISFSLIIGRILLKLVRSDSWKIFQQTMREIRTLPNRLVREASLEPLQDVKNKNPLTSRTWNPIRILGRMTGRLLRKYIENRDIISKYTTLVSLGVNFALFPVYLPLSLVYNLFFILNK